MASEDNFVITIHGRGGHASSPHRVIDPLVIGAEIVLALQTIVAAASIHSYRRWCRAPNSSPMASATPSRRPVVIKGDTRSYSPAVQHLLEQRMRDRCAGICAAHGARVEVQYTTNLPRRSTQRCTSIPRIAAAQAVSDVPVIADIPPLDGLLKILVCF
jgi:hippurate hydrolase